MIKYKEKGCPIRFQTDDGGILMSATNTLKGEFYTHVHLWNWDVAQLRYVADVLEEARANGGKLVMKIES